MRARSAGSASRRSSISRSSRPSRWPSASSSATSCAPATGFSGTGDAGGGRRLRQAARSEQKTVEFILHIIPDSVVGAFAEGDILQVLLVRHPVRLRADGAGRARRVRCARSSTISATPFFGVIAIIMKAAPIGAFGAMAYTIGKYGPAALGNLGGLDRDLLRSLRRCSSSWCWAPSRGWPASPSSASSPTSRTSC